MYRGIFILLLLLSTADRSFSHDLQYDVSQGKAVVVDFFFADGTKFSYESYEIYAPGEAIPFQTGRTDRSGRIIFLPDREGPWRVKTFSEDGHGFDFSLEVGKGDVLKNIEKPLYERYMRVVTGIGIILGIFGVISLFSHRKRNL